MPTVRHRSQVIDTPTRFILPHTDNGSKRCRDGHPIQNMSFWLGELHYPECKVAKQQLLQALQNKPDLEELYLIARMPLCRPSSIEFETRTEYQQLITAISSMRKCKALALPPISVQGARQPLYGNDNGHLTAGQVADMVANMPELQELRFYIDTAEDGVDAVFSALARIALTCPQLRHIDVEGESHRLLGLEWTGGCEEALSAEQEAKLRFLMETGKERNAEFEANNPGKTSAIAEKVFNNLEGWRVERWGRQEYAGGDKCAESLLARYDWIGEDGIFQ